MPDKSVPTGHVTVTYNNRSINFKISKTSTAVTFLKTLNI